MTTHHATRRAMLAGVAAVPLAVVASAAPAATAAEALPTEIAGAAATPISDDPIFVAIEKHRRLEARFAAVVGELDELEQRLPKEVTRKPRVALYPKLDCKATCERFADHTLLRIEKGAPTEEMHWATRHAEVNDNALEIPKEHRAAWLADRHAALKADERALREARKAAGLTRLEKRWRTAINAADQAAQALIAMRPATIAGTLALVAHAIEYRDALIRDEDDHYILLDSVAWALGSQVPDEIARSIG